jgi:hypothetical protein
MKESHQDLCSGHIIHRKRVGLSGCSEERKNSFYCLKSNPDSSVVQSEDLLLNKLSYYVSCLVYPTSGWQRIYGNLQSRTLPSFTQTVEKDEALFPVDTV